MTAEFVYGDLTLTVEVSGSGTVTIEINGTDVYTTTKDRIIPVTTGTTFVLTASEENFTGWSGAVTSPALTISLDIESVKLIVTANFDDITNRTLYLVINGDGSVTVNTSATFTESIMLYFAVDTPIELVASATNFTGWTDADDKAVSNAATLRIPAITTNMELKANFDPNSWTLDLSIAGAGYVDVTFGGATNRYTAALTPLYFKDGDEVTLTASTTNFAGWSSAGAAVSNAATMIVDMDADKAFTATFMPSGNRALTLTIDGTGAVTETVTVAGIVYDESVILYFAIGTNLNLTASEENFTGWTGNIAPGITAANTLSIPLTMNVNRAVTATFSTVSWTLDLHIEGAGYVDVVFGGTTNRYVLSWTPLYFAEGDEVTLIASTTNFTGWTGDTTWGSVTLIVDMDKDWDLTASFVDPPLTTNTLILTINGTGAVTVDGVVYRDSDVLHFVTGTTVLLIADATNFTGWTGNIAPGITAANTLPIQLTLDTDRDVTATFDPSSRTLDLSIVGEGFVDVIFGGSTNTYDALLTTLYFKEGDEVTLTADPTNFVGWTSAGRKSYTLTANVLMDDDKAFTASFDEIGNKTIDLTIGGIGGTVTVDGVGYSSSDTLYFLTGTIVTLTADPTNFTGWTGDIATGINAANTISITVTMDVNRAITATFDTNSRTLDLYIAGLGGYVNVEFGGSTNKYTDDRTRLYFAEGDEVTLTANPVNFIGWTTGGLKLYTLTMIVSMDGNKAVTASFDEIGNKTIVLTLGGIGGTVTVDGVRYSSSDTLYFLTGTIVTLTADTTNFNFAGWTGDIATGVTAVNTGKITVTMDVNRVITAMFSEIGSYELLLTISGGGAVDVTFEGVTNRYTETEPLYFENGSTVTLKAIPTNFVGWTGDLESQALEITVLMNADQEVEAKFNRIDGNKTIVLTMTEGGGSVVVNDVTYSSNVTLYFRTGDPVTVDVEPNAGYLFSKWTGVFTGNVTPQNMKMDANVTLGAVFLRVGTPITITGVITDIDGNGIPDVVVTYIINGDETTLFEAVTDADGVYKFTVPIGTEVTITEVSGERYTLDPEDQVPLDLGLVTYDLDGVDFIVIRSNDIPTFMYLLPMIAMMLIMLAGYLYWFIAGFFRNRLDVFQIHLPDAKIKGKERAQKGKRYKFTIEGEKPNFVMYQVGKEGEWKFLEPNKKGVYTIPKEEVTDHMTVNLA